MDEKRKLEWGRRLTGELLKKWPKDENGEPGRARFPHPLQMP